MEQRVNKLEVSQAVIETRVESLVDDTKAIRKAMESVDRTFTGFVKENAVSAAKTQATMDRMEANHQHQGKQMLESIHEQKVDTKRNTEDIIKMNDWKKSVENKIIGGKWVVACITAISAFIGAFIGFIAKIF